MAASSLSASFLSVLTSFIVCIISSAIFRASSVTVVFFRSDATLSSDDSICATLSFTLALKSLRLVLVVLIPFCTPVTSSIPVSTCPLRLSISSCAFPTDVVSSLLADIRLSIVVSYVIRLLLTAVSLSVNSFILLLVSISPDTLLVCSKTVRITTSTNCASILCCSVDTAVSVIFVATAFFFSFS